MEPWLLSLIIKFPSQWLGRKKLHRCQEKLLASHGACPGGTCWTLLIWLWCEDRRSDTMKAELSRLSLVPGRLSGALVLVAWIPAPFGGAQAAELFLRNRFTWVNPNSLSPHSQVPGCFLNHSQCQLTSQQGCLVWSESVENTWGLLPPSGYNWCSGWLLSYQTKEKGQRSTQLWGSVLYMQYCVQYIQRIQIYTPFFVASASTPCDLNYLA